MRKFKTNFKKLFTCFLCIAVSSSFVTMNINASQRHVTTSVCAVSGEKLIAKKPGTTNITMYYDGYKEAEKKIKVTVSADTSKIKVPKTSIKKLQNQKGKK